MLRTIPRALILAALLAAGPAAAQTTEIALGGLRTDPNAPVEISADRLEANQTGGNAVFSGNVVVGQGPLRLAAPRVEVVYAADGSGGVDRVLAMGGVTLTSGPDAAEAEQAVFSIESGQVVMMGNVLLTQGATTIAGQRLTANLEDGTGLMEGRVAVVIPSSRDGGDGSN